jgi:hypothetical protein
MQYSWTLLLDDQGDSITQLDDSGQVVGLWQNADGDQMWAPSTYFCDGTADTPTPTLEASDTPPATATATPTAVVVVVRETAPPAPAPPAARPAPPAPPQVIVVTATPEDTVAPTDTPEPTETSTPTSSPTATATSTRSPTATRSPTPSATPTVVLRVADYTVPTASMFMAAPGRSPSADYDRSIGPEPLAPDPRTEIAHDLALPVFGVITARWLRICERCSHDERTCACDRPRWLSQPLIGPTWLDPP